MKCVTLRQATNQRTAISDQSISVTLYKPQDVGTVWGDHSPAP